MMRSMLIALGALAASIATGVGADEIRVLSAAAVQVPVTEVAARFTQDTGHRVTFEFATAGQIDEKLSAGARHDVVINGSGRIAARKNAENP